jgi:hypothetical protein
MTEAERATCWDDDCPGPAPEAWVYDPRDRSWSVTCECGEKITTREGNNDRDI